jgi:hypothetical protein
MPWGPTAALATKGYFVHQRHRRGRQLGRVVATRDSAIVTDQLCAGAVGLTKARIPLIEAAEPVLALDATKRQRTILRSDSGGGRIDAINWALARGYQIHTKDYSRRPARKLGTA